MIKKTIFIVFITFLVSFSLNSISISIKKTKKNLAFVPSGEVVLENDSISVQSFYITKTEVTNAEYKLFLNDLKLNNKIKEYKICVPDTVQWEKLTLGAMSPFKDYYFSHPAYQNYPVVNVSFEAAILYCKWFTEKINAKSKTKFNDFRLPTREEFVRASRGDKHNQEYAWQGNSVWNKDSSILCNHIHLTKSKVAGNLKESTDIIAPAKSYWPNQFGIYNLNGNVAEMTSEKGVATGGSWKNIATDVMNESVMNYQNPNPTLGFRLVSTRLI